MDLKDFENSLCDPCNHARCIKGVWPALEQVDEVWCRYCGGSGLKRTIAINHVGGFLYPATPLDQDAPYLQKDHLVEQDNARSRAK